MAFRHPGSVLPDPATAAMKERETGSAASHTPNGLTRLSLYFFPIPVIQ